MSKKESYWFSHDSNAGNNPKLLALKRKYGFEGYGRWWTLLERLRECQEYRYDISTPFAWEVLGQDLHCTAAEAEAFVRECIDYYQLLESDGQVFWSPSMLDRMEYWERRKETLRERGRKGAMVVNAKKKVQDAEERLSGGTSEEQARLSDGTSDEVPQPNTANETLINKTIQNDTKQYNTTIVNMTEDGEEVKEEVAMNNKENAPRAEDMQEQQQLPEGLTMLRDRALADDKMFVYAYVSTGKLNKEQLGHWLTAFNKWLVFTGEELKEERDYRRHFSNWFRYRDVVHEDPLAYNPAEKPKAPEPAKTVPLPAILPPEQPVGKFSKGDNKYDMHWLRKVRDEVRKMG